MNDKSRRTFGVNALDKFLPMVAGDALKKRGFGEFKILTEWEKIVGPHLARYSTPVKMVFERGKQTGGSLHIQVTSAMALEFQHLQPMILERIATYFGYPAVAKFVLIQVTQSSMQKKEAKKEMPSGKDVPLKDTILSSIADCPDEELRASLLSFAQTLNHNPKKE